MAKGDYNRLTQEEFITKAATVHNSRYDYSLVAYVSGRRKVKIVCPQHGIFEQAAESHLSGCGCKKCGFLRMSDSLASDTVSFIAKAHTIHGTNYLDYAETSYDRQGQKVKIACPLHGPFEQEPTSHLAGSGCPGCAGQCRAANNRARGAAAFLARAKALHSNKYDYSQAVYIDAHSRVKIICPVHGIFEQPAIKHTSGRGCTKCANRERGYKIKKGTAYFLKKAKEIHGSLYDYSQTIYTKSVEKVKIICPQHGPFEQQACMHILRGKRKASGCPKCAFDAIKSSWAERYDGQQVSLYFIKLFNANEIFYKVGITSVDLPIRYKKAVLNGYEFELLAIHHSLNAFAIYEWERSILETFCHIKYWPKREFAGATECFSSADEILAIFPL